MNKIIDRFKKLMLVSMGFSIIDIIVGIIFILCTSFSLKINSLILGALILIHGLFLIIRYIYDGLGVKIFSVDLIIAVAAIILGIFTMFNLFDVLSIIGILFGLWLGLVGIEKIYYGYKFMKNHEEIYPLVSFIALLLFVMGILVIINPFDNFMLITRLIGIFMICTGLFEIMFSNLLIRRASAIIDIFK